MNVALTLSIVPAANVTACAFVRMYTEKGIAYDVNGVGIPFERQVEVRRVEFVACDGFVWVDTHAYTRTAATPDKWTSLRTEFSRVDEETMSVKLCVHA